MGHSLQGFQNLVAVQARPQVNAVALGSGAKGCTECKGALTARGHQKLSASVVQRSVRLTCG
eukprot:1158060-Pelagomonas_calceolata.AAC.2